MASATEAQIKSEIERLTATINQHKMHSRNENLNQGGYTTNYTAKQTGRRSNVYVNPNYKPANKYIRPGLNGAASETAIATDSSEAGLSSTSYVGVSSAPAPETGTVVPTLSSGVGAQKKEIVLGGVAFESSGRSLVRKDLPRLNKPASVGKSAFKIRHHPYGHKPPTRAYKMKARRGRNLTLNYSRRPYPRKSSKRLNKYSDKPCPRFTTTGACTRGLTCMYQHDPSKIAICWNFLQDQCPNSAETCNLSHEPIPQRTPLCLHFLNKGRCNREKCPFPHVNVGQRLGVCRDFAVLGYCEQGLDCDRQHVRECPDFAEKGHCGTKGCKLPHVIRANRNRKATVTKVNVETDVVAGSDTVVLTAEDGQLGDEYISLTFKESDSEDGEESESESGTESDMGEEEDEDEDDSVMDVNM